MFHAMAGVALAALLTPAANAAAPQWLTDYDQAKELSRRDAKPLAVVVGRGDNGWRQLAIGEFSDEVLTRFRTDYVCLYVDAANGGAKLAGQLKAADGPALILGDRKAEVLAFRHVGKLDNAGLEKVLAYYADPARGTPATTVSTGTPAVAPTPAPVYMQPTPVYYPQAYPAYGGSSCPNCRR